MKGVFLTDRALMDIDVADEYLVDLNDALRRLAEDLALFKGRHDYAGRLRFYRAREHVIVGDVVGDCGYVLTVWHGSMDFIDRLPKLEPELLREAELMARQIETDHTEDT